ncbi:oligosaccharide flippase family protein, partial [Akkermansiaceae bacterium]|nr:oligosaccharide flippase family protein [Akkermansiaceae bacterium]
MISYFTLFVGNIIPILYTPYVIGKLGVDEYGVYSLAKSFALYFGLMSLGVGGAVLKFVNQAVAENDSRARDNIFTIFTCVYSVISLAVLLCGGGLSVYSGRIFGGISDNLDVTLQVLIGAVTLNTALSMFFGLYGAVVHSHHKFIFYKTLGALATLAAPALSALVLWFGYRSVAMMCVAVFLTLLFGVAQIFYVHRVLGVHFCFGRIDWGPLRSVFHFSKYLFLGAIATVLYDATDKVILGMYANAAAVAVYSVGAMLSMYTATLARGVSDLLFPKINTMVARGVAISEVEALMLKVGRLQYVILGYLLCGFILFGDRFIFLWVGDEFNSAYWIALLIMVPMSVPRLQSCGVSFLMAMNRHG